MILPTRTSLHPSPGFFIVRGSKNVDIMEGDGDGWRRSLVICLRMNYWMF